VGRWSDLFEVLVEKEWLVGAGGPIFLGSQFESQRDFLTFWLPDLLSVWLYSSYFLNHISVS
jgi:hypothetical protein